MRLTRIFSLACLFTLVSAMAYTHFRREGADETGKAAQAFLKQLTPDQLKVAQMPYAAPERVDWHFIPKPARKGMQYKLMNPAQRESAMLLLRSVVSQLGYKKATTIMSMEKLLHELEGGKGPTFATLSGTSSRCLATRLARTRGACRSRGTICP